MDYFKIKGGKVLSGDIYINGAKNSVLELMAASLLTDKPVTLYNVPNLSDVATMLEMLEYLGTKINWNKQNHTLHLHTPKIINTKAPYDIVKRMRASIYVLGSLMGRCGNAEVSFPGGCVIGQRPINIHLKALESLGASIKLDEGYIVATAPVINNKQRLQGGVINGLVNDDKNNPITTHGGTVNAIEAAVLANGETIIEYASLEPEVDDLINMLNKMGANIKREVKDSVNIIRIVGVDKLSGCEYSVMPDRLEAGTYAILAFMVKGKINIHNADLNTLVALTDKFKEIGGKIISTDDGFIADGTDINLKSTSISVSQYPGFPTDMQSQFMAMMTIAKGESVLKEKLFENRFMYAPELIRMGADIEVQGTNQIKIIGVKNLKGADVMASDLRSGAALTLAGLVADGETKLHRVYHIYRGYENFVDNLKLLGADIEVLTENVV